MLSPYHHSISILCGFTTSTKIGISCLSVYIQAFVVFVHVNAAASGKYDFITIVEDRVYSLCRGKFSQIFNNTPTDFWEKQCKRNGQENFGYCFSTTVMGITNMAYLLSKNYPNDESSKLCKRHD